jgi:hypothetical protein
MEAIETTPVAPDIFMRGRVSVRFVRDDEGSITGFDYANPVVRRLRYERLGDLDGTDSDEPPPEREDR